MNERNEQMAAMLAAGAPAARDLAFEIAVLAKIERRRFHREIVRNLAAAAVAAGLLALVMPQLGLTLDWGALGNALSQLTGNVPVMAALLLAAFAAWYFRPVANA